MLPVGPSMMKRMAAPAGENASGWSGRMVFLHRVIVSRKLLGGPLTFVRVTANPIAFPASRTRFRMLSEESPVPEVPPGDSSVPSCEPYSAILNAIKRCSICPLGIGTG